MLVEYIEEAMKTAKYEIIKDAEPFYGEIPACRGVLTTGKTFEECRENLQDALEGWLLLHIQRNLPIPSIHGKTIKLSRPVHA